MEFLEKVTLVNSNKTLTFPMLYLYKDILGNLQVYHDFPPLFDSNFILYKKQQH